MFEIGKIYRYSKEADHTQTIVDGLPNYFAETYVSGFQKFQFQRGIHKVADIKCTDGTTRCPVIIISSSPHKAGSDETPWQDKYDPDRGYIRYYGDGKVGKDLLDGNNRVLLDLLKIYESDKIEDRKLSAVPIVFFERTTVDNRKKGNLKFQGFGILERAELVTQYDTKKDGYFSNYLFNFCVFSLCENNESFDWQWIAKRCDPSLTTEETNRFAPASWKKWVKQGKDSIHQVRRNVVSFDTVSKDEQLPVQGSKEYSRLLDIYHYYDGKKHNFEYLALEVTKKVIEENGTGCTPGWITKKSGDGGIDYVLRVDIGNEKLSGVKIVVLGQAKCTKPTEKTNGQDIARTLARLKRGWIGAFVTTSYYSIPVQQELNEDLYPIMLINGKKVANIVEKELFESGMELNDYLDSLETRYRIEKRPTEDILFQ